MRTLIFSVFDVKADSYGTPFFMPTRGMAIRAFADLAKDKQTTVGMHPEDFKLVRLGEMDDVTGKVEAVDLESLGFASDYIGLGDSVIPLGVKKGA